MAESALAYRYRYCPWTPHVQPHFPGCIGQVNHKDKNVLNGGQFALDAAMAQDRDFFIKTARSAGSRSSGCNAIIAEHAQFQPLVMDNFKPRLPPTVPRRAQSALSPTTCSTFSARNKRRSVCLRRKHFETAPHEAREGEFHLNNQKEPRAIGIRRRCEGTGAARRAPTSGTSGAEASHRVKDSVTKQREGGPFRPGSCGERSE